MVKLDSSGSDVEIEIRFIHKFWESEITLESQTIDDSTCCWQLQHTLHVFNVISNDLRGTTGKIALNRTHVSNHSCCRATEQLRQFDGK